MDIQFPKDLLEKLSDRKARKRLFSPAAPFEVQKVRQGMPGEKAGLKEGDKIMGINEKGIRYFQELQDVLILLKDKVLLKV
jgi:S1-C subfamily serine protease